MAGTVVCLIALVAGWICHSRAGAQDYGTASVWHGAALALFIASYIAGGWHTVVHVVEELREGEINVDLLMLAAAAGSAWLDKWAEGATLLFLFSLSHTLETYILGRTRRAIAALMKLTPDFAVVVRDGGEVRVPVAELQAGDLMLVHPGERIPADGVLRVGRTSVDQSPMTGESIPVDKEPGDPVFAGTLNQQGVVRVQVSRAAGESTLARMVQLVEKAQSERAASQRFTEWFGVRYTWFVLALSTATLCIPWLILGESWTAAFQRAMTILVVASPCAVVISIPAAILTAITSAARGGVLFKGGAALEDAARLKAFAFDKTGTLTVGRPRVVAVIAARDVDPSELLTWAAALEEHSEHPLAQAVVRAAQERGLTWDDAADVAAVTGHGVTGRWRGRPLKVGKVSWFAAQAEQTDSACRAAVADAQQRGETVVVVADDERWLGAIAIADTLRPSAGDCLRELRAQGIRELVMLTGDSEAVAKELAGRLGIAYAASLLPADKLERIRSLRESAGPTAMVGDGMNDAPSLAAATVGFSLGGAGTDVALETADVVILADDLRRLPYAVALAREAQFIIQQNLWLAFSVMGGLLLAAYAGELPLPLAVLGHEGSTVLVILNGLRLLRFPRPQSLPRPATKRTPEAAVAVGAEGP